MATDIHYKIRGYLRQKGQNDMTKYNMNLNCVNGQTTVGRWDYDGVPTPTTELLDAVPQQYLQYESERVPTCDAFNVTGTGIRKFVNYNLVLTPIRNPVVSTQGSDGYIRLQPGLYKFHVVGEFSDPNRGRTRCYVRLIRKKLSSIEYVRRCLVTTEDFDFTAILKQTTESEFKLDATHSEPTQQYNVVATIIIERL